MVDDYDADPRTRSDEAVEHEDSATANLDPRQLYSTPSIDEVRWYYRHSGIAQTVVDKPVDDAFKHGFTLRSRDGGQELPPDSDTVEFLDEILSSFKEGNRKARRDGFALLWFRLRDDNREWQQPSNVQDMHEVKVLSLDDMTIAKPIGFEEKLSAGNAENIEDDDALIATTSAEEAQTLADLVELAEDGAVPTDGGDESPVRIARDADDTQRFDTDRLTDPEIEREDVAGRLAYGRSRYYDTSDNGIVFSNRLDDTRFEKPIGYLYSRGAEFQPLLIHPSRVFHITWNGDVDGYVEDDDVWGGYEGDPILLPILNLLRDIQKANWATGQNLFRHSSPLHVMDYEDEATEESVDDAEDAIRNINAKSSLTVPPGFDLDVLDAQADAPVSDSYSVLFDQICAGTEFTRSVLFGTQAGTVSGSETDIKNYFNKVEKMRNDRFSSELREILSWYADLDANDYSPTADVTFEWGPLFKLTALDRAEAMARHIQTASQATNNYVLGLDEVRNLLQEQWADWSDIELDEGLTDEQMDELDRTNTILTKNIAEGVVPEGIDLEEYAAMASASGTGSDQSDEMDDGSPAVGQNGGGMETGQTTGSADPTSQ